MVKLGKREEMKIILVKHFHYLCSSKVKMNVLYFCFIQLPHFQENNIVGSQ